MIRLLVRRTPAIACFALILASSAGAQIPVPDVTVSNTRPPAELGVTVFGATSLGLGPVHSMLIGVEVQGLSESARPANGEARQIEVSYRIDATPDSPPTSVAALMLSDRDTVRRAAREGVRILTRVPLGLGAHVVHVTVRDTADQRTTSVTHEFDVPNLLVGEVTMSQLLISGSADGSVTQPALDDETLMPLVGRPPGGRRAFSRREKVEVNAEIYEAPADDGFGGQLRITTAILASDGHVVYEATDVGSSETLPSGVFGYQHYALVPIAALEPGAYFVRVLVASDGGINTWRAVPITVRD